MATTTTAATGTLPAGASTFDAMDAAMAVRGLSAPEKHLLLVLARHWPNVRPSVPRLAQAMGRSQSQTYEWLGKLEARGLVETHQRGAGRTAERVLHLPAPPTDS